MTVGRLDTNRIIDSISGMGGAVISTPVLSLIRSTSAMPPSQNRCHRVAYVGENPTTNIYDNHDVAMPNNAYFGGNHFDPLHHLTQPYPGLAAERHARFL